MRTSREIGSDLNLALVWRLDRHKEHQVGCSHFFAGEFIKESDPSADIDFAYASM